MFQTRVRNRVSHLRCLFQCFLSELGKRRVGFECQIHIAVR